MSTIDKDCVISIHKLIDAYTSDSSVIPGFVMNVVNQKGDLLVNYASGKMGIDNPAPMTTDSVFWLASCSKLIGAICAMQQVEKGLIGLDDSDKLEEICPELKNVKVIKMVNKKPTLVEKKNRITLRMLLSHTAGFSYSFFHPWLIKLYPEVDELAGDKHVLDTALVFEPGTDWGYGTSMDWVGVVIERLRGMPVSQVVQKDIFEPLGITDIEMRPTQDMRERLVNLHQKHPDGKMTQREHVYSLDAEFESFGAGYFAKGSEYTKLLAMLLNNGVGPKTGKRVLSQNSVDTMFTNQIPQWPNYGRRASPPGKPEYTNALPELYPQGDAPQGWGISFMLTIEPTDTGRGNNTAWWSGIINTFWWVDREKGVAGLAQSQILPFGDEDVMCLWNTIEAMVYKSLVVEPKPKTRL